MADPAPASPPDPTRAAPSGLPGASSSQTLGSATYEIIRQRLAKQGDLLRERMRQLDERRQEVFGSIEFKILQADRITTAHNCVPRDMVQLGRGRFLFGFNVHFGLKKEMELGDVFAIYHRDQATGTFKEAGLEILQDRQFLVDFKRLYNVYQKASFAKFSLIGNALYLVFQIGSGLNDLSVFKWEFNGGNLRFIDGRSEGEYRKVGFLPQYEFRWLTPDRESFRYGDHPHVSVVDRVFVECVGGDLTVKIEDTTTSGEGIYSEPVEDKKQKVDDAEIAYALLDHLILLKVRPYKETAARFFIFNEKQQSVVRVDSLGKSCALLPEEHGLIFPAGYYLATGGLKVFEAREQNLTLERVVHAPNGEDSLYVFYGREEGEYVLLPYRLIAQRVEERITCHGFSLFADGHLLLLRADAEAQKHHQIQFRQTPFYQPGHEPAGKPDAFLYRLGNKEVVRCLAEINEVLTLLARETPYAEMYVDLVKRCGAMLDAYPWLNSPDGFQLDVALRDVQGAADHAVDEFDKVRRLQREAVLRVTEIRKRSDERFNLIRRASFRTLEEFVQNLTALRQLRGELITLKEVRYVEVAQLAMIEQTVTAQAEELSRACVKFLVQPTALDPQRKQAQEQLAAVDHVAKVVDVRKIEKAVGEAGAGLEMLIEIVSSLQIADATEATRIIDGITAIYSTLNQVKAALRNRLQTLVAMEGAAQFNAQIKLLGQSTASYLDLSTTPAKCEEYLNRLTVQLEELEGAFADFEDYAIQLAEKRTSLYEAFEQRKVSLVEQRNRKAAALMTAAERILKVIQNRLTGFKSLDEINSYMAADLMIAKVRETIAQLMALEDSVKADDLQGRLKSLQQEAIRLLKDRQELFQGGEGVIKLGRHQFNINTQPLDLTCVQREGRQYLHLTSTQFFEEITDEGLLATRKVWDQEVISETKEVYRAEYLAQRFLADLEAMSPASESTKKRLHLTDVLALPESDRLRLIDEFIGAHPQDGYTKGIHDFDGALIFEALLSTHVALKLARYAPVVRACAVIFWHRFIPSEARDLWHAKLKGFAERNRLFPGDTLQRGYVAGLGDLVSQFARSTGLYPEALASTAGEYLFYELISGDAFVVSYEATRLSAEFDQHLVSKGYEEAFRQGRKSLVGHPSSELELVRDWVRGFLLERPEFDRFLEELVAIQFCGADFRRNTSAAESIRSIKDLRGNHPLLRGGTYTFDYLSFRERLHRHEQEIVPLFEQYHRVKQLVLGRERKRLRLEEFRPRVLSSFVRNQLIDQVYLPLVGDNLAKQLGAAGDQKRTDLMGLLLLISPPGYGKTTLLEYLAARLGIVFIKVNGPALGHGVTSLDPEEAPNAAAREEVQKLNLALEMGDNVMLCVDDIQHCSAEFLQKFISLCDAQRKIEGTWRGHTRTYDLRGRKVVVVMAGNPYTESGQKFKIPDMLANRADTYNLGDIIGGSAEYFKASYLENAVTSNAALEPLANRSQKDIQSFISLAGQGQREGGNFEGSYSSQEVAEILSVMSKLVSIREIILRVNLEYIHSAAQADEFRTEPPFRLQGSYRNMNRLAEKVVPIMNDQEVSDLVLDHYRGESQTLTTGAEANLLKFKELIGRLSPEEQTRWDEIKRIFKRNQLIRGGDQNDPVSRVVAQLSGFQAGLESIQQTLAAQLARPPEAAVDLTPLGKGLEAINSALNRDSVTSLPTPQITVDLGPLGQALESVRAVLAEKLGAANAAPVLAPSGVSSELAMILNQGLAALREDLSRAITAVHSGTMADKVTSVMHELEMIHSTLATLKDISARQRDHVRAVEQLLTARAKQGTVEIELTQEMLANERAFLDRFHQVLADAESTPPESNPPIEANQKKRS